MTLLIHHVILLWDIEFPEEVEGDDSVTVDDDGEQHARQDQLQRGEKEVLEMTSNSDAFAYSSNNALYFVSSLNMDDQTTWSFLGHNGFPCLVIPIYLLVIQYKQNKLKRLLHVYMTLLNSLMSQRVIAVNSIFFYTSWLVVHWLTL